MRIFYNIKNMLQLLPVALPLELGAFCSDKALRASKNELAGIGVWTP
jgi:hypothetical protein